MLIHVTEVRPLGGYRLWLRFDDGAEGDLDLSEVISFDGVFSPLKDPAFFGSVRVHPDWGTLCWPGDLDLAPEPLYERATGRTPEYVERARASG
jgi:hypothetical protein